MDVISAKNTIPSTIKDLSKFILIGRERLISVRAEIRAIDKLGLARDVREQKLAEAQAIAEAVLDAEVRIGELFAELPKNKVGRPSQIIDSTVDNFPMKSEVIREAGFSQKQAERFQTMAAHPETVEQVKAEARENDDIVTREQVIRKITKPYITRSTGNTEWYTPKEYVEAARSVMGSIDLDPASSAEANRIVRAKRYFSAKENGLKQDWYGNIWVNPPYRADLIGPFIDKIVRESANFDQAVIMVNNATETRWFKKLVGVSSAIVFPTGRIHFCQPDGRTGPPLQGQAVLYIGSNAEEFLSRFRAFGWGVLL